MLLLDMVEVEKTWTAIQGRIGRNPVFQVLPDEAQATIESVIMVNHDEAFDRWPSFSLVHTKCRVHFWKEKVRAAVPAAKAGIFAVYFHEYVAASTRGEMAGVEDDESSCSMIPSYGGHARAAHDAWVACTASLA